MAKEDFDGECQRTAEDLVLSLETTGSIQEIAHAHYRAGKHRQAYQWYLCDTIATDAHEGRQVTFKAFCEAMDDMQGPIDPILNPA